MYAALTLGFRFNSLHGWCGRLSRGSKAEAIPLSTSTVRQRLRLSIEAVDGSLQWRSYKILAQLSGMAAAT